MTNEMKWLPWRITWLVVAAMTCISVIACGGAANASDTAEPVAQDATSQISNLIAASGSTQDVEQSAINTGSSGYSVPPESMPDGESRLYVKFEGVEGTGIPIRNGGLVHMGGGIDAEVFVDPYPADSLTAWLDLYLEKDGQPLTDAQTVILYDMWSMGHGPYTGMSDAATDGHYVFRLDYVMFGAWEQVLEVRLPGTDEVERLKVIVVAVP